MADSSVVKNNTCNATVQKNVKWRSIFPQFDIQCSYLHVLNKWVLPPIPHPPLTPAPQDITMRTYALWQMSKLPHMKKKRDTEKHQQYIENSLTAIKFSGKYSFRLHVFFKLVHYGCPTSFLFWVKCPFLSFIWGAFLQPCLFLMGG